MPDPDPKPIKVQDLMARWKARTDAAIDKADLRGCSEEVIEILTQTPTEETGYKTPFRKE